MIILEAAALRLYAPRHEADPRRRHPPAGFARSVVLTYKHPRLRVQGYD